MPAIGADRASTAGATDALWDKIPLMTYALDDRPLKIYKVAFDGTLNDAARVPSGERETIVAHIAQIIRADHYYPGAGMQDPHFVNVADAALGYSSVKTAEVAERDFMSQASAWVQADPRVEIRVFVTGFSRGAATARHFMNVVTRDWPGCPGCAASNRPEFFALLYDTVATFQMETLQLSLPPSVNYLIHVMATDEPRGAFRPLVDTEYAGNSSSAGAHDAHASRRLHLVVLPGSHSDVGAAYPGGVGDVYRDTTEMWLHQFGLIKQSCWESASDPYLAGKHDSRGWLDLLVLTAAPNSARSASRRAYVEPAQAVDDSTRQSLEMRLRALQDAHAVVEDGMFIHRVTSPSLQIRLERYGQDLTILGIDSPGVDLGSVKYEVSKDGRQIAFHYLAGPAFETKLTLDDDIWRRLPEGSVATLSYTVLKTPEGESYLGIDVNGVSLGARKAHEGPSTTFVAEHPWCARDPDGTLVSPVQIIKFSSNDPPVQERAAGGDPR